MNDELNIGELFESANKEMLFDLCVDIIYDNNKIDTTNIKFSDNVCCYCNIVDVFNVLLDDEGIKLFVVNKNIGFGINVRTFTIDSSLRELLLLAQILKFYLVSDEDAEEYYWAIPNDEDVSQEKYIQDLYWVTIMNLLQTVKELKEMIK